MIALLPFGVALVLAGAVFAGLIATAAPGTADLWPIVENERTERLYLVCSRGFLIAFLATGALDWGSGPLALPTSLLGGGIGLVVGAAVTMKAGFDLGEATSAAVGDLQTEGVYRFSRHPQTVGYGIVYGSIAVLTNSPLVGVLAVVGTGWLVLQAYLEEPWLCEHFGDPYEAYRRRTPRFLGVRSFRRLIGDWIRRSD